MSVVALVFERKEEGMTVCPECGYVYDESDYAQCPMCEDED